MTNHDRLKHAFDATPSLFRLLSTVRSRRVGRGYRIDSGTELRHPVTGRPMKQDEGPMKFVSRKPPAPLTRLEEALLCWAACGPNGLVMVEVSMDGGFQETTWVSGRTAPAPGTSHATDLLVINDAGASIYRPTRRREKPIEIESEADYDKVLRWFEEGTIRILDERPDVDWALRAPGAPNATLMGPYQFNLNMPGSTWIIPITDAGWINSVLVNLFGFWHTYPIDEWNGGRPAGVEKWVREGMLELPVPISAQEQLSLQVESYPTGCMVQNVRLAAEAMGLGTWAFCGFNPDVLFGAMPAIARGLGFHVEAPNPKAPVATGQLKVFGIEGVKEATYVPSPRFKTAEAVVEHWFAERYGPGGVFHQGPESYLRQVASPWKPKTTDAILADPRIHPAPWVKEALISYVDYCVQHFGQWPVTYNPMQAHFGAVVHEVDEEFYDAYYAGDYVPERMRNRSRVWRD
jgi:hypothetical protein